MRIPAALFSLALAAPAMAAAPAADASQTTNCPRTTSYLANQKGGYRGLPLTPRKLTQLPPATGYMAVLRHIGGCEAPLTMVEYRNPRGR